MDWIFSLLDHLTYPVIAFLMLLESTVVPLPSELVLAPAAYHAAAGDQNLILVIVAATVGADLGASVNYFVAYFLGRPLVYAFANSRAGKLCLLSTEKLEKAEAYFNRHGMVATITGRLIIGIRHLISIPAGLAKMNYWRFLLYTTIGSAIWHTVLGIFGWYLHSVVPEDRLAATVSKYGEYITVGVVVVVGVVFAVIGLRYYRRRHKNR